MAETKARATFPAESPKYIMGRKLPPETSGGNLGWLTKCFEKMSRHWKLFQMKAEMYVRSCSKDKQIS
jgi:hypothetical protein